MPSAKTGTAPDASSKNVTKIILTMVFFMFSPWVEWIRLSPRQSIAADCRRKSTKCVFSNLQNMRNVFGLSGFATCWCVRLLDKLGGTLCTLSG